MKKELKKIAAQKIADESFPDVGFRHFESFVPQCMAMKSESPPSKVLARSILDGYFI